MPQSAIQPDVQPSTTPDSLPPATPPSDDDPVAKKLSEREQAMAAIEQRHLQQLAAESGVELPADAPTPTPEPEPNPDDQLALQMNDTPASTPAPTEPQKIKVNVDGTEKEVPLEEVIRQYQKAGSADQRLAEAKRVQRETLELAERIKAEKDAIEQQRQLQLQQQTQTPPEPAPDVQAVGKDFLKALFEGDEETALQKLSALTSAGRQVQAPAIPDVNQLASTVAQQVQQKLAIESALAQHRKDYPQLYADPDMEGLALMKIERMRAEEGLDFFTALDSVSRDMAGKFGWNKPAEPAPTPAPQPGRQPEATPTTSPRTAKLEAKAAIDNVTSLNTRTTSTEPVVESVSDVIAQMRAQRLGNVG